MSPRFESMRPERLQQKLLLGEPAAWDWLTNKVIKPAAGKYAKRVLGPHGEYQVQELVAAALVRVFEALRTWKSGNLVGYLHTAAERAFQQFHTEQHAGTVGRSDSSGGPIARRGASRMDDPRATDMLDFSAALPGGFVSEAEFGAFEAAFDIAEWELDSATFLGVLREAEPVGDADAEKRVNAVCARILLGSLASKSRDRLAGLVDAAERANLVSHEDAEAVRAYLALAPEERAALLGASKSSGVSKRWSDPVKRVVAVIWFATGETREGVETLADHAGRVAALDAIRLGMVRPSGELAKKLVATLDEPRGSDELLREWVDRTRRKGDRVLTAIRSWMLLLDLAATARTLMRFKPSQTDLALAGCLAPFKDPCAPQDGVCPRCGAQSVRRLHEGEWCLAEMALRERDGRPEHPLWGRWSRPGAREDARHAISRLLGTLGRLQDAGIERIARAIARERVMLGEEDLDVLLDAVARTACDADRRCS
ncbi:MAG: hypothetical protein QMD96_09005 [Anaerosomatales bacterium]|nr:hypothetical protein [Anaerosomatales bacterium]